MAVVNSTEEMTLKGMKEKKSYSTPKAWDRGLLLFYWKGDVR